ncbi:MAG: apolipoprotein N-acyltransferase [bacterium]|nr:apolipoprotein N-acyltransferase [bacterium]
MPQLNLREISLAALAGLLVTLGLPPVPGTGLLVPVGLALLMVLLKDTPRPGRLLWVFALFHQTSLLHWLFLLIPAKTIPTRALVPIQASLAIFYVTVFYLLLGWLFGLLKRRLGSVTALLLMPVLWTGMEALRAQGEMAFPWCLTGSSVVSGPLMGWLRASGEIGISSLVIFLSVAMAFVWFWYQNRKSNRLPVLVANLGFGILLLSIVIASQMKPQWGASESIDQASMQATTSVPLRIAAIQANVSLADKWQKGKIDSTRVPYGQLTRQAAENGADFVIWAETALPAYIRFDTRHLVWLRNLIRESGVALFTGFPDAERLANGTTEKFNSSGLFDSGGTLLDRYAKYHLLPIGEAMPFTSFFPGLAKIDVGQAEWTPGQPPEAMVLPTENGGFPFSGLICFESILAHQARNSVRRGSRCLVVLTNDGWFGKTAGPKQHTKMALLRAAENSVPLIRCANNGISLISDDKGRVQAELGLGLRGVVQAEVLPGSGQTMYVRYGAWPLFWFLMTWTVAVVLIFRKEIK